MNVVDSSAWLEYFSNSPQSKYFAEAIENIQELIVPTISLYEVFKRILQQRNETLALQAIATMMQGRVIDLDSSLALSAAKLSFELKLPMADSIILATAQHYQAMLWTQDEDFKNLAGVKYYEKNK
jgi:toxin FitB